MLHYYVKVIDAVILLQARTATIDKSVWLMDLPSFPEEIGMKRRGGGW